MDYFTSFAMTVLTHYYCKNHHSKPTSSLQELLATHGNLGIATTTHNPISSLRELLATRGNLVILNSSLQKPPYHTLPSQRPLYHQCCHCEDHYTTNTVIARTEGSWQSQYGVQLFIHIILFLFCFCIGY